MRTILMIVSSDEFEYIEVKDEFRELVLSVDGLSMNGKPRPSLDRLHAMLIVNDCKELGERVSKVDAFAKGCTVSVIRWD